MKNNTRVLVKQSGEKNWRNGWKFYYKKVDGKHLCYSSGDKRTFVSWDYVKEYKEQTLGGAIDEAYCKNPTDVKEYYNDKIYELHKNIIIPIGTTFKNIGYQKISFDKDCYEALLPMGKDATISVFLNQDAIDFLERRK